MKKFFAVLLTLVCACAVLLLPASAASIQDYPIDEEYYKNNPYRGTTLNVYNWGEYISDGSEDTLDVNAYFEELTGIKINYTNFDSNEDMYAKVKSGGANYDVVFPSDYMIERMRNEDMLVKLDYNNIPNYAKYIDSKYKGLYYDENEEYTVPYNVGYVALIYNTKLVKEVPTSWSVLWDEDYAGQILMFNNARDGFGIAMSYLGLDYNTTDPEDWEKAYQALVEQKPLVRSYVMDEVFNIMESGAAAMAPYYVGDYFVMAENNPDLAVAFPEEGANIFVDAACIPNTTQNQGAAELYINFLCEPQIALANAETICYASPNTAVVNAEEYTFYQNTTLYPEDESLMEKYQYFHNLDSETLSLMTQLWSDLKVEGIQNKSTYIGLGIFLALAIIYAIYAFVRKKRREKYYD